MAARNLTLRPDVIAAPLMRPLWTPCGPIMHPAIQGVQIPCQTPTRPQQGKLETRLQVKHQYLRPFFSPRVKISCRYSACDAADKMQNAWQRPAPYKRSIPPRTQPRHNRASHSFCNERTSHARAPIRFVPDDRRPGTGAGPPLVPGALWGYQTVQSSTEMQLYFGKMISGPRSHAAAR